MDGAPVSAPVADAPISSEASGDPAAPGMSPWEAFKAIPEFQGRSDLDIARELYSSRIGYQESQRQLAQYQRLVPYAEYGQRYSQNAEAFERWQREQAQAAQVQAQPKQPEQAKWWNPPQIDETLKAYIVRDQNGREIIDPNAPVEAQQKLRAFQDYTAQFARKFVTNPEETLKPFVENEAKRIAQEIVQEQFKQRQTQEFVQGLESQHADWMYDAPGVPSREGQAIQAYIAEGQQYGITDPQKLWQYASGQLRADLQAIRYQQLAQRGAPQYGAPQATQPVGTPVQYGPNGEPWQAGIPVQPQQVPTGMSADVQFLRDRATRKPNRSAGAGEPRAPHAKVTFEQMLSNQLVADGAI
jgi:hypothetical protein